MGYQDFEWKYEAKEKIKKLKRDKKSGIRLAPIIRSTSGAFAGKTYTTSTGERVVKQVRPFREKRVVGYRVSWRE